MFSVPELSFPSGCRARLRLGLGTTVKARLVGQVIPQGADLLIMSALIVACLLYNLSQI